MTGDNLARVRAYEPELQRAEAPKIKHKKLPKPKSEARLKCVKRVAFGLIAFALMFALVYGKVELSRITNEQSELMAQLAQLEENNLSLESELEAKTSLVKVEDYAENVLGMQKLDKSQIEYISLESGNKAEVSAANDNIFTDIKQTMDNFVEYLRK